MFTAAQAVAQGWTARQVRRRLQARRWLPVAGAGLAAPQPQWTAFQLAMAASLTWPRCVASHLTAAALHGFPVPVEQVAHVIAAPGSASRRAIRAHRIPLRPDEVTAIAAGVLVTTGSRTAADCLAGLPFGVALDLWAWLSSRRLIDADDLARLIRDRPGWHGVVQLRRLARFTADGTASAAEHKLHDLLNDAGIRGWVAAARVFDLDGVIGVVDLLFAEQGVVVEVDGWRAHSSRQAFRDDRRRQNRLVAAGFIVLRFTWDDLIRTPQAVITQIRTALLRAGATS